MLVPVLVLLACELELTVSAGAIGRGLRRSHPVLTALATLAVAIGFAAAVLVVWALWFIAPACVAGGVCAPPAGAAAWFGAGAAAEWAWLLVVALAVRRGPAWGRTVA
jgi:hypothetical protein